MPLSWRPAIPAVWPISPMAFVGKMSPCAWSIPSPCWRRPTAPKRPLLMSSGETTGFHWATERPVRLVWQDGLIREIEPPLTDSLIQTSLIGPEKIWLALPLFDLQVNGFAGVDFQRDDFSAA